MIWWGKILPVISALARFPWVLINAFYPNFGKVSKLIWPMLLSPDFKRLLQDCPSLFLCKMNQMNQMKVYSKLKTCWFWWYFILCLSELTHFQLNNFSFTNNRLTFKYATTPFPELSPSPCNIDSHNPFRLHHAFVNGVANCNFIG